MSISVTHIVRKSVSYPEFGAACALTSEYKEVTYTAKALLGLNSATALAQVSFDVNIEGVESVGVYYFSFTYSGAGNPLDEAESALIAYLSNE